MSSRPSRHRPVCGRIVARSEVPAVIVPGGSVQGSTLLIDNGSVLIATSAGLFRAFGGSDSAWERIEPPAGLPTPSSITRLQQDPEGRGLYLMNNDSVAFWRFK